MIIEEFAVPRAQIVRGYVDATLKLAGLKRGRGRPRGSRSAGPKPSRLDVVDPLLTAHESAAEAGCSIAAWWRGVKTQRFPQPFYVTPSSPRWRRSEINAAVEALRARPVEAVAARRAAKHQRR